MARQEREGNGQNSKEQSQQITDLCFNIYGHALKDPLPDHDSAEMINARSPSSTMWDKIVAKEPEKVYRENLTFSPKEQSDFEEGTTRFVIVGYALSNVGKTYQKQAAHIQKQKPVGIVRPSEILEVDFHEPLFVVAEVSDSRPVQTQLYTLLKPLDGLCTPYRIGQQEVFYRHEFRDSTTNQADRMRNWNQNIHEFTVKPQISTGAEDIKEKSFRRARDQSKLQLRPNQGLVVELRSLVNSFCQNQDPSFLQQMKSVLKDLDDDLECVPNPDNALLRKFIEGKAHSKPCSDSSDTVSDLTDSGLDFTMKEAEELKTEILETWPDLRLPDSPLITAVRLQLLRRGIEEADETLEYRLAKSFIVQGCVLLDSIKELKSEVPCTTESEEEIVTHYQDNNAKCRLLAGTALKSVRLHHSQIKPGATVSKDHYIGLLECITEKLSEVLEAAKEFDRELLDSIGGDVGVEGTPSDIWAYYAEATDTDSARAAFFAVMRHCVRGTCGRERGLAGMVEDLKCLLDKVLQKLPNA